MLKVKLKPNKLRNILLAVIPGLIVAGFWGFAGSNPRTLFDDSLPGLMIIDANDNDKKTIIAANPLETEWQCGDDLEYEDETYATVLINDQCWMAENLNIGTRIDGVNEQDNDSVIQKYCYNNSDANCTTDGGLYQWAQAMDLPYTCNSTSTCTINTPHQGICPDGWHIPSDQDWYDLTDYLTANGQYWCGNDMSTYIAKSLATTDDVQPNWTNSNTACCVGNDRSTNNLTGFSVLPAGYRLTDGSFGGRTLSSYLWSASQHIATQAWPRNLLYNSATVGRNVGSKMSGFSVRCIKD